MQELVENILMPDMAECFTSGFTTNPQPYNSFGNGAAMRVSPCGFAASSMEEAISLAHAVTKVTHNHPEGMKAAEAARRQSTWQ